MGLESISAFEDVIGDLPSPWATINKKKMEAIENEGVGRSGHTSRVDYFHVSIRVKNVPIDPGHCWIVCRVYTL